MWRTETESASQEQSSSPVDGPRVAFHYLSQRLESSNGGRRHNQNLRMSFRVGILIGTLPLTVP